MNVLCFGGLSRARWPEPAICLGEPGRASLELPCEGAVAVGHHVGVPGLVPWGGCDVTPGVPSLAEPCQREGGGQ